MKRIMSFLSTFNGPPSLSSRELRQRKTLNMMLLACVLACIITLISMAIFDLAHVGYSGRSQLFFGIVFFTATVFIIVLIERYVSFFAASLLFMLLITFGTILSDTPQQFLEGQSIIFMLFPVILAGLLLRPWASYIAAAVFVIYQLVGYIVYHTGVPNIPALILFFIVAGIIAYATSSLERAVEAAQKKSRALAESDKAITQQNQRIQEISQKLLEVQEKEKHLLAAELHDDLGQSLTSLKLLLELISRAPSSSKRQEKIAEASEMVTELMSRVRTLSLDLRPAMLDDFGLFAALRWWFDLFQARTGITVRCNYDLESKQRFSPQVETAAFRIIQEALTNVARHAAVWEAEVGLSTGSLLSIEVSDQGSGFNVTEVTRHEDDSVGISGMEERVHLLGGTLHILSATGSGTRVVARIPC